MKKYALITMGMFVGSLAFAGGGGTGGNNGPGTGGEEPAPMATRLVCGTDENGANGLELKGTFDGFAISFEKSGAVFLGYLDGINANSEQQFDINDRRAITESFHDDGAVIEAQFRVLPADDVDANATAKRLDIIKVGFSRANRVAFVRIVSKNMMTGQTTTKKQNIACSIE